MVISLAVPCAKKRNLCNLTLQRTVCSNVMQILVNGLQLLFRFMNYFHCQLQREGNYVTKLWDIFYSFKKWKINACLKKSMDLKDCWAESFFAAFPPSLARRAAGFSEGSIHPSLPVCHSQGLATTMSTAWVVQCAYVRERQWVLVCKGLFLQGHWAQVTTGSCFPELFQWCVCMCVCSA